MAVISRSEEQQIMSGAEPGATPDQIKAAFRESGDTFESDQQYDRFGKENRAARGAAGFGALNDTVAGALKGIGSTAYNVGNTLTKVVDAVMPGPSPLKNTDQIAKDLLEPKNIPQKIGYVGEKAAEFFVPGGPAGELTKAGELAIDAYKLSPIIRGALKVGLEATSQAVQMGGVTALQTGGDVDKTLGAAETGALFGGIAKTLEPVFGLVFPAAAKKLEKLNLRLTPPQARDLGSKVDDVANFMRESGASVGTPAARLEKVNTIYTDMEDAYQNFLKNDAKDVTVSKDKVISELEAIKTAHKADRDAKVIAKQVDDAIEVLKVNHPDEIPIADLNTFKRTTYQNAYNNTGTKVLDGIEHEIGDVARTNIEQATEGMTIDGKSVADFNKEYGTAITARRALRTASTRAEVGTFGRIVSILIGNQLGKAVGGTAGEIAGTVIAQPVANLVAGTLARSLISKGFDKLAKLPPVELEAALLKIVMPLLQKRQEQDSSAGN